VTLHRGGRRRTPGSDNEICRLVVADAAPVVLIKHDDTCWTRADRIGRRGLALYRRAVKVRLI